MGQPLGLFDLDGTLTRPGTKLVLDRFVFNDQYGLGIPERRLDLRELFLKWDRENKAKIDIKQYEVHLRNVGSAYAQMCRGCKREAVIGQAKKWFEETGHNLILPYSGQVIANVKEAGVRPVMISGAPFELAYWFADKLGIEHIFSMEAEVDSADSYTGEMEIEKNIGLNLNKVATRKSLSARGHPIIFAMGDTGSDVPLFRGAIERHHDKDAMGQAVLVNPSQDVEDGANFWLREWLSDGKLTIIPQGREEKAVVKAIRHILKDVLEENGKSSEAPAS